MIIVFLLNLIIVISEIYILSRLKNKLEVFKYYTYLQNVICLIVSSLFLIYLVGNVLFDSVIPEYIRGLRYVVSTSLVFASIIYIVFLSSNKKNRINDKEFVGISGKKANIILHYLCPILSLVSFICFEKSIILDNSIWTLLVIIPSCLYWVIYLVLSICKVWVEPYDFSNKSGKKNIIFDILSVVSIPFLFVLISFIVWNLR